MLVARYLVALLPAVAMAAAWHTDLSYSGGGYWRSRLPVTFRAPGGSLPAGVVDMRVGTGPGELRLGGSTVQELRVANAAGLEYLFRVSRGGRDIESGTIQPGDLIQFPIDGAGAPSVIYYVYTGNPDAQPLADFLNPVLRNGSFESGSRSPAAWTSGGADPDSTAAWLGQGRGGSRCAYHKAAVSAPPRLRWSQTGITISEGRKYTVRAWVKANGVTGEAGWSLQVNGEMPGILRKELSAGSGTFDWREVTETFVAPKGARSVDVATLIEGRGEAWYDDVSLTEESPAGLIAEAAPPEQMQLAARLAAGRWLSGSPEPWRVRAELRVLNFDSTPQRAALITAEIRRAVHMLGRITGQPTQPFRLQVVSAATGRSIPHAWLEERLCFAADIPARSDNRFFVYLATGGTPGASELYSRLLNGPSNLLRHGDFESRDAVAREWPASVENSPGTAVDARVVQDSVSGRHALRLHIPPAATVPPTGSRQQHIPVRPGARYLIAGYLRTEGVAGRGADLEVRFKTAANEAARGSAAARTGRPVLGTSGWILRSALFSTPADAATAEFHLTLRTSGTVYYDGLMLAEVQPAAVMRTEYDRALEPRSGLSLTAVNPMVKVFPDDPPLPVRSTVELSAARNEWEPLQVALWSAKPLRGVQAALSIANGARLEVRGFRVGNVGVDLPSAYYVTRVAEWCRKIPRGAARTDGWAGEWPDPLPPLTTFDLPARRTQALWFDVFVPPETPPGDFHGEVTVKADGIAPVRLPLTLRVRGFTLPEKRNLKIVYDLRSGPGWNVTGGSSPEVLRSWYRLLAEHRVNPDSIAPYPVFRYENGHVVMDAKRFDQMAKYAFDELGITSTYTPSIFYALGWAYRPKEMFGFQPFTPEYERTFKEAYRLYVDHMSKNGWRDKIVYYLSDEPHFDQKQVVDDLRYVISLAREVAPDVPVFSSTWRHCPGLDGFLTMWGIAQYGGFPLDALDARLKAGDRAWFTTDGQQALDTPYLGTERLLPAYCFKYGVEGYEFWGISWWTYDPWDRSWHKFIRQSDQGKEYYWIRYPNGDGYLTYPGIRAGLDEPVGSIRLKAVREGAEDYEYYVLLREEIARGRKRGADLSAAQHLLAELGEMVTIPNAGGLRSTEIMPDPDAVYRLRARIAEQISLLQAH